MSRRNLDRNITQQLQIPECRSGFVAVTVLFVGHVVEDLLRNRFNQGTRKYRNFVLHGGAYNVYQTESFSPSAATILLCLRIYFWKISTVYLEHIHLVFVKTTPYSSPILGGQISRALFILFAQAASSAPPTIAISVWSYSSFSQLDHQASILLL